MPQSKSINCYMWNQFTNQPCYHQRRSKNLLDLTFGETEKKLNCCKDCFVERWLSTKNVKLLSERDIKHQKGSCLAVAFESGVLSYKVEGSGCRTAVEQTPAKQDF